MKISIKQLRQVIKEELEAIHEDNLTPASQDMGNTLQNTLGLLRQAGQGVSQALIGVHNDQVADELSAINADIANATKKLQAKMKFLSTLSKAPPVPRPVAKKNPAAN